MLGVMQDIKLHKATSLLSLLSMGLNSQGRMRNKKRMQITITYRKLKYYVRGIK